MRSIRAIKVLDSIPVLLRTSLNAPVKDGKVTQAFRLKSALPTINYLRERHARVILISHVSGAGVETLRPMYEAMKVWIPDLQFCEVATGPQAREAVRALPPGGVLMLENLRRNPGEETNDPAFAKELASLGDVFVQDSFDVCHRTHASVVGVPAFLPSYAGFTLEREVTELHTAMKPKHPALAIIAGAKFSTKEPLLKILLKSYDHVAVGGALANDFIHVQGHATGASLVSKEGQESVRALLKNRRLIVPHDVVVAPPKSTRAAGRQTVVSDIGPHEAALDIGPDSVAKLCELIRKAKTVLWNGPLGLYEQGFTDATLALARAIAASKARSIVGGGDTIAAIESLELSEQFSFISTGGGAMLDYLADGSLPGLDALQVR